MIELNNTIYIIMENRHKSLYNSSQKSSYYPPILKFSKTDCVNKNKGIGTVRKSM